MHTRTCKACGKTTVDWVLRKGKPTGGICRSCHNARYRAYAKAQVAVLRPKRAAYCATRRAVDSLFKTKGILQTITWRAVSFYPANSKASWVLGCTHQELCAWLEQQFKPGMHFSNFGEWQVDHRIPLCKAQTLDELYALCHWSNLQPLWVHENKQKKSTAPTGWQLELRLLLFQYL